jgi:hypothetical protein
VAVNSNAHIGDVVREGLVVRDACADQGKAFVTEVVRIHGVGGIGDTGSASVFGGWVTSMIAGAAIARSPPKAIQSHRAVQNVNIKSISLLSLQLKRLTEKKRKVQLIPKTKTPCAMAMHPILEHL